jgi:hypothetical protein
MPKSCWLEFYDEGSWYVKDPYLLAAVDTEVLASLLTAFLFSLSESVPMLMLKSNPSSYKSNRMRNRNLHRQPLYFHLRKN